MIRLLSRVLKPYWRIVVTPPNGDQFVLPQRYRSLGDAAQSGRPLHELLMSDEGFRHELRRYR